MANFLEETAYKVGEFEAKQRAWGEAIAAFMPLVSEEIVKENFSDATEQDVADVKLSLVHRWLAALVDFEFSSPASLNGLSLSPLLAVPVEHSVICAVRPWLLRERAEEVFKSFVAAVRAKVDESGELQVFSDPKMTIKKVAPGRYVLVF